jgi:oligopeptide transport system substrate-binding protein
MLHTNFRKGTKALIIAGLLLAIATANSPSLLAEPSGPGTLSPDIPPYPEPLFILDANLGTEPPTLDPAVATDTASIDVIENLFLGLTGIDEEGNVVPELTTHWTVSADGRTYTFHLRDDVRWVHYSLGSGVSEVRPVTAYDVEYGVKRSLDPRTGSDYAYLLYIIEGAMALNCADPDALTEAELQVLIDGVGVRALNDVTVEFRLERPASYFPSIVSMWVARPVPREPIEEQGERWTEPGFCWSNGPYALAEWIHDSRLTLVKNPHYYDANNVQIEQVRLHMITAASTALAMYEANELDTVSPSLDAMDRIKTDPVLSKQLHIAPRDCSYYYGFTNTKPPMDNALVRQALSAAIDRQRLTDHVTGGYQIPANTFAPPMIFGSAAHDPDIAPWALPRSLGGTGYAEALRLARRWLAEAGYPNGQGFPTIALMHNTSEGHRRIADAIAAMWRDGLGITVEVQDLEWRDYLRLISRDTSVEEMPHVWRLGWCADYPDQNNWVYEVFHSSQQYTNWVRWHNSEFDQITEAARAETNPTIRRNLYHRAEEILVEEEAAMAPIYYYSRLYLTKPWLKRSYHSFGQRYDLWRLTFAAESVDGTGGVLISWDDSTTITVPAGALGEPTQLLHVPQTPTDPAGLLINTDYVFELTASDASGRPATLLPGQTYTITIGYDETALCAAIEETVMLYSWHGSQWVLEPSSVLNPEANTVTATPDHFSLFALLGETRQTFLPALLRE